MTEQQPPYQVGQVVNGHRWTGETWEQVEAGAPVPPPGQPGEGPAQGEKPWFKKWWAIAGMAVAALLVVGAVASGGEESTDTASDGDGTSASAEPSEEPTDEVAEEVTDEVTEEPAEESAPSFSGDGIYEVGSEIKAGLYVSEGSGYWERLSGATGEFDDIIANDNANGNTVVEIKSSDEFFSTDSMDTWTRTS